MFYSQFILARKGSLGTIWIAAHLERKLRKNQVADTDIGESVDSILFPDVPIALRLSSHLLLGVVRIYSRKVNYLYHDCSETLLNVRDAFRTTPTDLPPEESTAPYHSITLPDTFDLDDFELPDTALLSGNFVDRHISAREQITLQDKIDAPGYSISKFGLDERFGDGDASQIGLNLDEDIIMNKELSHPDNLLVPERSEHDEDIANMEVEEHEIDAEEQHIMGTSEKAHDVSEPTETQLPDNSECAETPSTPALMQETRIDLREDADRLNYSFTLQRCTSGLDQETHAEPPIQDLAVDASEFPEGDKSQGDMYGELGQEDVVSKSSRIEVNCSASSEYPEPEKMLLAVREDEFIAKDLEELPSEDKGTTESDGSVDGGLSTRGKKRRVTENSRPLTGSFAKSSGTSKSRRKGKRVPDENGNDDDDVLASILAGPSSLELKSTPSASTARPSKRQRQTPKTRVPKKKTQLDDTMVLNPDTIRKQLINTEDIRRTRRKAPCTRPEIWMIEKSILEEGIFREPALNGLTAELAILHEQTFQSNNAPDPEFKEDYSLSEPPQVKNSNENEKSTLDDQKDGQNDEIHVSDDVSHEAVSLMSASNNEGCAINNEEPAKVDEGSDDAAVPTTRGPEGVLAESTDDQNGSLTEALPGFSGTEVEDPSAGGENSAYHNAVDLEKSQLLDPKDSNDFCSAVEGNDTGFLIEDDETDLDEAEYEEPDDEEAQSTENSGWSIRTKGVARFLKNLFVAVDETTPGRTAVAVDRLLSGKSRKEASRMFFETLVLSTKEFIFVDQERSFENISIRPRSKLLKSEF